ncbi:MAG: saccharopine dehydrogenase NADP-binding domain-containing protein [Gammaproteobacteria bacterium]|nr:saccharopine dehydrogenase NADP-binding domain-containing protein [Gammaproteobacteria bacterium]
MTQSVTVFGAGLVGRAIVADLCPEFSTRVADVDETRLTALAQQYAVETQQADLAKSDTIAALSADSDLVVCAVPGFMGFATLKAIIESGTDVVDISFFDRDPFELDGLAKENGVTAITDCGVAPGMSNLIVGYHNATMKVESFDCMVGGLPFDRVWPYEYKAPFSPSDVIEEYVRPARLRENGEVVIRPALSEAELIEIEPVGTLEAFNTDGLRTLLDTTSIPNMRERTLRYPGHIELMRVLRESGFFDTTALQIGGASIRPRDLTAALLFPLWKAGPGEEEFTVMVIEITGLENGETVTHRYHLFDKDDPATGLSSMARTTGFTATAAARLVLDGSFRQAGISPPESVGAVSGCLQKMLAMLSERGVTYQHSRRA